MSHFDFSCFSEVSQKFLICVTIQSAKRLNILNVDTFVLVTFNKAHKRTLVYQNSDCPYFNEYFVFEIDCSLSQLLKQSILIRVLQKTWVCRKDSLIGELAVDLRSIWESESIMRRLTRMGQRFTVFYFRSCNFGQVGIIGT